MVVETVKIRGATIVVHDDSYANRTKEEINSSIEEYCRIVSENLQKKTA